MSQNGVIAGFIGCCALITYRDYTQADPSWPLGPVPPPYRYVWTGVAFGILALVADFIDPRIADVIAGGLFMGLAFNVVTKTTSTAGLAPASADLANASPAVTSTPVVGNG